MTNSNTNSINNITQKVLISTIDAIANQIAGKFRFGYHDIDDLKQEARLLGLEGFARYDGRAPLYNFLRSHIRNRLNNFKRDNYQRISTPCEKCPLNAWIKDTNTCTAFREKDECDIYMKWWIRNENKRNIMSPIGMAVISDQEEDACKSNDEIVGRLANREIFEMLDSEISRENRASWLKYAAGHKLYESETKLLVENIYEIIERKNIRL